MTPLDDFFVTVAALGGWTASAAWWRFKVNRSLHELARVSQSREIEPEDLVLAFTPKPIPTRTKPAHRPAQRRVSR